MTCYRVFFIVFNETIISDRHSISATEFNINNVNQCADYITLRQLSQLHSAKFLDAVSINSLFLISEQYSPRKQQIKEYV